MAQSKPNGFILYEGKSLIDGQTDIVCIVTGIRRASGNAKTGAMVQSWVLVQDQKPVDAIKCGADAAVCGNCIHRGIDGKKRSCYVNVGQAPQSVWKAYRAGRYPTYSADPKEHTRLLAGKHLRIGSYGDPAAVPVDLWQLMLRKVSGHTGYTHQWSNPAFEAFQGFLMASADDSETMLDAYVKGWRTFRVLKPGETRHHGLLNAEISCPADYISCDKCRKCAGADHGHFNVCIPVHGSGATHFRAEK